MANQALLHSILSTRHNKASLMALHTIKREANGLLEGVLEVVTVRSPNGESSQRTDPNTDTIFPIAHPGFS